MKVLMLNAKFYADSDLQCRKEEDMVNRIMAYNPDVIVLTEFGIGWSYSKRISGNQIISILDAGGFKWIKHKTGAMNKCDTHMFAKKGLKNTPIHLESETHLPNRRFGIVIDSTGLHIFGVYMASKKSDREKCWNYVEGYAKAYGACDAVIVGDFNECLPKDDEAGEGTMLYNRLGGLENLGWYDAWRLKHNDGKEYTWKGRRLDHAFVTYSLTKRLVSAEHLHEFQDKGFSDHSALVIEIADT